MWNAFIFPALFVGGCVIIGGACVYSTIRTWTGADIDDKPIVELEDLVEDTLEDVGPTLAERMWGTSPEAFLEKPSENYSESPLEIFSVFVEGTGLFFSFLSLNTLLCFFLIIFLLNLLFSLKISIYENISIFLFSKSFFEIFFNIFKNLVASLRMERFFILIISVFLFILFSNVSGFSLYELSLTSQIIVAMFFSFIIFFNFLINILLNFNEETYEKFLQKSNIILLPVLFLIELVSFFVRPFSLGVRLFANVLSGHILIHMFFSVSLYFYKVVFWVSIFVIFFCVFIFSLELFVSCVQSYIFLILSFVYLGDVFSKH